MSDELLQAWGRTLRRRGSDRALIQAANGAECRFAELDRRAERWAARARDTGLRLAQRAVVFALPNGADWLEAFLGVIKLGAVAVPMDAAEPPAAQRETARSLRAAAWWDGIRLIPLEHPRRYRDTRLALIKLTSGSTGSPRPLVFRAGELLADARQVTGSMGIGADDLNYALIPFGHSYGLGNLSLPLIALGIPAVIGTAPLPHAIAADFTRWRPTVFPGVPALFRALAAARVPLPGLRLAISAGATLPVETARAFAEATGVRLHSFYGSSETGGIAYDRSGQGALAGHVGRPLRGVTVEFLRGRRLRVGSAAVLTHGRRQDGRPQGTWLMPDLVERAPGGAFRLVGRRGSLVKLGGRRVDLGEILLHLRRLPGVTDAWVGVHEAPEPQLGAAVVGVGNAAAFRGALQAALPAWKVPKRWVVLPSLPLTARGKTDRAALLARVFGPARAAPDASP